MARDELQVIDRTYELLKWFLRRLEKFPRSHRYGLGQQIEQRLYKHKWPRPAHAAIAPVGALEDHVQVLGQSVPVCSGLGRQTNR